MDTKQPSPSSPPSSPARPPRPRRRTYLSIALVLGLTFFAYRWYLYTRISEVSVLYRAPRPQRCDPNEPIRRVAVIGAGSAGSSAAYYLSKSKRRCDRTNITIYERSSYIGGRSTTVNVFDSPSEPVELGASIFVKVNRNLVDAVKTFGLSTQGFRQEEEDFAHDLGIYNGQEWVYIQDNDDSYWWNIAKLFWRYGTAPLLTRNLMKSTTEKFFKMYDAPFFPFKDLSQVVYDVGLTDVTAVTGEQYLKQNGISEKFGRELIQACTRVNYAQNLDTIHGLETMVCMATDGAMSVEGGNWRIFANMVIASKAEVKLETRVTGLELLKDGTYSLTVDSQASGEASAEPATKVSDPAIYDHIILAAPLQYANLTITPRPINAPPEIPYVSLHVTLFTSKHRLNPLAFKLPPTDRVPATILTTLPRKGIHESPPFYSISTLRSLINPSTGKREYLYKIFSPAPITHTFLHTILYSDENHDHQKSPREHVSWLHTKIWHSYPIESPRVTFEDLVIDLDEASLPVNEGRDPMAMGHLWYTSGIEGFISTMETSSLMGKNIARLIVDGWGGEKRDERGAVPGGERGEAKESRLSVDVEKVQSPTVGVEEL